jgi:hypothetical protein
MQGRNILRIGAISLGSLGVVVTAVQNIQALGLMVFEHFWILASSTWLLVTAAIWPDSPGPQSGFKFDAKESKLLSIASKYKWVLLFTLLCTSITAWRYWELHRAVRAPHPFPHDIPPRSSNIQGELRLVSNHAINSRLALSQFGIIPEKTSFRESNKGFEGVGKPLQTFSLNIDLMAPILDGKCSPGFAYSASRATEALQRYAKAHGKETLLAYIQTPQQLQSLVHLRPDVAAQLLPSKGEWLEFSASDYDSVLAWVKDCIGIPYPVFIVTLENTDDREAVITTVTYDVKRTGQAMGGSAGPLSPKIRYSHELRYQIGKQKIDLVPPFAIPAKSSGSFELQLSTKHPDIGLCWLMSIEFGGNVGTARTSAFQLIMSGESQWQKGVIK